MFGGEYEKSVMGDRGGGVHGKRLLCNGVIDLNGREGCFVVGVNEEVELLA